MRRWARRKMFASQKTSSTPPKYKDMIAPVPIPVSVCAATAAEFMSKEKEIELDLDIDLDLKKEIKNGADPQSHKNQTDQKQQQQEQHEHLQESGQSGLKKRRRNGNVAPSSLNGNDIAESKVLKEPSCLEEALAFGVERMCQTVSIHMVPDW
jgi:hypothetical protein